jgi:DNA helicase IV
MDQLEKDSLRLNAQKHIEVVKSHIATEKAELGETVERLDQIIKGAVKGSHDEESTDIEKILMAEKAQRLDELKKLTNSPYFSKCVIHFDSNKETKTVYFGKFPFFPDSIYSWTTPIARLRYESPGTFSYVSEDDLPITGDLLYKEQYMIVDGHVVFMAVEGHGQPRELVYQERLMRKKTDFSLPEIVEQMEKAQDDVIRASWKGSFLIAGPAGSGKTTLALHRVAYLTQAPETEQLFPSHTIVVFVQDASTKAYFSNLLPELGIRKVLITTFEEWLIEKLKIKNVFFVQKYGRNEDEKDLYEWAKNKALKDIASWVNDTEDYTNVYDSLESVYLHYFPPQLTTLFNRQREERKLDRFDLSVLGKLKIHRDGSLTQEVAQYELLKRMKSKKTIAQVPINYSLIVVDEAENYLQEQIEILISCKSKKTQAVLYVGDLAQQTRAYTIKNWSGVGESFGSERKVVLQKVYRNTRQILEYINLVGFKTVVPDVVQTGKDVQEFTVHNKAHEIERVEEMVENSSAGVIGILSKTDEYLEAYRSVFEKDKNVKIMTINESQGVEFDAVFLVGVDRHYFGGHNSEFSFTDERRHVDRDLLYVALTRAMNELYVFGREPLKDIISYLNG